MRKILKAEEGFILTDGVNYGREILLEEGRSETDFHQITEEEYNAIMEAEVNENLTNL